ncbi:MAG TPA: type 4a pilus biogenesis protein PilO [Patescibacteria group bacterium]|nr:type 4a pilus biogenesis protein PilO [Patescibacteria group bacterium]
MKLSFKELTWPVQLAVLVGLGAAVLAAGELAPAPFPLSGARQMLESDTNESREQARELASLTSFEQRHDELLSAIAASRTQLALLRQALPRDKELDQFMFQLEHAAAASGVSIRQITARPVIPREDHFEMPFQVDLDGPYFGVEQFLKQLSLAPRIINVGDLKIDGLNHPAKYTTPPRATVDGTLTVITFFQGQPQPPRRQGPGAIRR